MSDRPTRKGTWWLSFADDDRGGNLGIVLADGFEPEDWHDMRAQNVAILRETHRRGCNPGGEVASSFIPAGTTTGDGAYDAWFKTAERYKLYSVDDLPFACVNKAGKKRGEKP